MNIDTYGRSSKVTLLDLTLAMNEVNNMEEEMRSESEKEELG